MFRRSQGGQNSIRSVFLRPSPPYFLKQGLSLNLELINYQPANFLDPPDSASQFWEYRCATTLGLLYGCWGT